MKRLADARLAIGLLVLALTWLGCESNSLTSRGSGGVQFTDTGLLLYEKFLFDSEGELFFLSDVDSHDILVPSGAALVCIRKSYSIGVFPERVKVDVGSGNHVSLPKVFFIIKSSGRITFHKPSESDGRFAGDLLPIKHLSVSWTKRVRTEKGFGQEKHCHGLIHQLK